MIGFPTCTTGSLCVLPYSGKLSREKTFAKYDFRGKNFCRWLAFAAPKVPCSQISWRKISQIAAKPQNSRKFLPLKVSRYTVVYRFTKVSIFYGETEDLLQIELQAMPAKLFLCVQVVCYIIVHCLPQPSAHN